MSQLGLNGVFSGIDTDVLIARSMAFNRIPLNRLETQKSDWQAKDDALADLEARMTTFKSQVDSLRSSATLEKVVGTSLDNDILSASASAGATQGTHQVVINQLAQAHRFVHNEGLASTTTTVGAAKSTAFNLNGMVDPDATWFTTSGSGATYTFDFDSEDDITGVVFDASTGYSMNQVAALINVRSQAVNGYDAASVEADAQTGESYLRLTAQNGATTGVMAQTLTAGDAVAELNDADDWTKTAAGGGTFSYTYDSITRAVSVTSDTTLEGLRDLINNDARNPGVSASILEYNSAYHLVLAGKDTGTSYSITIDNLATTIEGFDTPDFVETQTARDLEFRVDGYPAEAWITRDSNTVTDVIPNVTITANATGSASINITRDASMIRSDLSNLAAVYNGLLDKIAEYAGYDEETETGGVLQGDTSIARLLDSLRSGVTSAVPGFLSGTDTFTLASEIGLEFGQTDGNGLPVFADIGRMFLDDAELSSALMSDYSAVLDLIGGSGTGVSDNSDIQFTNSHDSTEGGVYNVRVDFNASGLVTLAMIRKDGETAWRNLTISASDGKLTGEVGNAEQYLELTAVWDGSGAYTATGDVRVRQGFGNVLYDSVSDLLDNVTGVIAGKRKHYESAIETIDTNIEFQERLLATKEMYLEEKYARMETALAKLDSQRAAFDALFASLENNSNSNNDD